MPIGRVTGYTLRPIRRQKARDKGSSHLGYGLRWTSLIGLLRRMTTHGGLQHCIGKEVSRFEQGKDDFIENIDDVCIHYDGGRVAANESLIEQLRARGLRKLTKQTRLDRKTIRAILNGKKVKGSTLAKVVAGLRDPVMRFSSPCSAISVFENCRRC